MLSPVSTRTTGNVSLLMACLTALGGAGEFKLELLSEAPDFVCESLGFALGQVGVSVGDHDDTRRHVRHIGVVVAAGEADGEEAGIFFKLGGFPRRGVEAAHASYIGESW